MNKDENSLDHVLDNVDLSEKTEMGEVANNIFQRGAGRTNLSEEEGALCFINDAIFKGLQLDDLNPVENFMEIKKSVKGWSTEKFVQGMGGITNSRSGGMLGGIKDALFKPRQ